MVFSKCIAKTEKGGKTVYILNDILDYKIEKGYKKEIGKTIREIYKIEIISTYEKKVRYEHNTIKHQLELAEDFCKLTGAKRKQLNSWLKAFELSDTDILTDNEMKKVQRENDIELERLAKKHNAKAHGGGASVYINVLAKK